jgi:hypothetical protein
VVECRNTEYMHQPTPSRSKERVYERRNCRSLSKDDQRA